MVFFSLLHRPSAPAVKANGFLLSALSPVWRAKICRDFAGGSGQHLDLQGDNLSELSNLLALGSGSPVRTESLSELLSLGRFANRYQVEVVQRAVEDAVLSAHLTLETCASILTCSCAGGLERLEAGSRELALREFDRLSQTSGFMELDEDLLGSLLDSDGLASEREERVFEALLRWMEGGGDGGGTTLRGEGLLRKVRFPFMEGLYLANVARDALPGHAGLDALLLDAGMLRGIARSMWAGQRPRALDQ